MGFYPFSPADPKYIISVPLFDKVEIKLEGKIFTIIKKKSGKKITGITYSDKKVEDYFITDAEMKQKKNLVITTE